MTREPVDFLCLAPHPDDAELCCGGLLLLAKGAGLRIAIADCTRGEMGTRGSVATRRREAAAADRLLGTDARVNLGLRDGHLKDGAPLREALVRVLRRFRPSVLLAPHWEDQHPDHAAVGQAAIAAAWLCGAPKYAPASARGVAAPGRLPYRPALVLHYQNRYGIAAGLVVDVSAVMERKAALAACYATQFGPGSRRLRGAPMTRLSSSGFERWFRAQHVYYGHKIGVAYGEAYGLKGPAPVWCVSALLPQVVGSPGRVVR